MIVKDYIKAFEQYGLGLFVHFGVYSLLGEGEWARRNGILSHDEYDALYQRFNPAPDWTTRLVATAKAAGCRYITLTTRHHDGFSLYDTRGLSNYDAPHSLAGRDLVGEFVSACRKENITPFFYHTLLDWYAPAYRADFPAYLVYLRKSIALLCRNYGEIGGIWFDGMWDKPNADWEEDALYALIRRHQPNAMIINNTGLDARGALGHIELDSVTFERGRPSPINLDTSPKYIASEMCQVFADHWGYAKHDFNYKSLPHIIADFCACRRHGANFLLNVGPTENGYLRPLDDALLRTLGEWVALNQEALYFPRPSGIELEGNPKNFMLKGKEAYYLFFHDLKMGGSSNVVVSASTYDNSVAKFKFDKTIQSVKWLDEDTEIQPSFTQNENEVEIHAGKQRYGINMPVRVAKITV